MRLDNLKRNSEISCMAFWSRCGGGSNLCCNFPLLLQVDHVCLHTAAQHGHQYTTRRLSQHNTEIITTNMEIITTNTEIITTNMEIITTQHRNYHNTTWKLSQPTRRLSQHNTEIITTQHGDYHNTTRRLSQHNRDYHNTTRRL